MLAVIATIPVNGGPAAAALSPDGSRVYVGTGSTSTIPVVNSATNIVTDTIGPAVGLQDVQQLVVHPDGTRLYVNTFGAITVVDPSAKTVLAVIPSSWAAQVAIHPDGSTLYLASGGDPDGNPDPRIVLIDTATNAVAGTIDVDGAYYVAVSPDGARLYVAGYTGDEMWAIDTATHAVVSTIGVGKPISGLVVSPDSSRVYVLGAVKFGVTTSSVNVVDVAAGTVTTAVTFPLGLEPTDFAVAPDGSAVYVTNVHGAVSLFDTATMTMSETVQVGDYAGAVAVSPNGSRVYVTNSHNNTVSVIARLHVAPGSIDLPDLVGKLIGGAAAGGGGWLVIGDHFFPIPPRAPVLQAIARAVAPHVGRPIKNQELGQRLRRTLAGPSAAVHRPENSPEH